MIVQPFWTRILNNQRPINKTNQRFEFINLKFVNVPQNTWGLLNLK